MRILFIVFWSFLSCSSFANVQEFVLENGLKILVKEDHRSPVAVSMLWYNVGAADEPPGLTGTSHALEHLMFKGTPNYPKGVFSKKIAQLGGLENAFTHHDYTAYFETISAEQLPIIFKLESDRMQSLLLDENEFLKEMKVIREERRLRTDDNPKALTFERYLASAYLVSSYRQPIIGWMHDLDRLNVQDLRNWYKQFYTPNNATLVVVGDVKAQKVYELAREHFGSITKQSQFSRTFHQEPQALGKKSVRVQAEARAPVLLFGYPVPSLKSSKEKWEPYALELITGILNAGEGARFAKRLRHGSEVASMLGVDYNLYSRNSTQFVLLGIPTKSHTIEEMKKGIVGELNLLKTELVSLEELKRIKTQFIAQKTFEKDSLFQQAMELGIVETIGLGWKITEKFVDEINKITPEQIRQVAQRYFSPSSETEAYLIPNEKKEHA